MIMDWIKAFSSGSLMSHILNEYQSMIENARWMFEAIGTSLIDQVSPNEYSEELLQRDKQLNRSERQIRKLIIEHLAINPSDDLGVSLVLFSGVKDAERLGDYCKNLQEVAYFLEGHGLPSDFTTRVSDIFHTIERQFKSTAEAFAKSDVAMARAIMDELVKVKKECNAVVKEVVAWPDDRSPKDAVTTTLVVRYFKRVAAHISNIASGVINPVHKIDYYIPEEQETLAN